jgi:hypothetical protein
MSAHRPPEEPEEPAHTRAWPTLFVFGLLSCTNGLAAQDFEIGIIDFYGLDRVTTAQVREALTFEEGDTLSMGDGRPAVLVESEQRLSELPEVVRARIDVTCCDQGRVIVYVGVEERGASALRFREAPEGDARLAADVVQAGEDYMQALFAAVRRGDAGEGWSQGHALSDDPTLRAVQERLLTYAGRDLPELRLVLRTSSDAEHRALAAHVLGYVDDKQAVVEELVWAMGDPSEDVRNNAMRSLLVFAATAPVQSRSVPRVPYEPFIRLLRSPFHSDLNKASAALASLASGRDPTLLARLRDEALGPLVEMARWKGLGHGLPAFEILGRLAGYSDEATHEAWVSGHREEVIAAALDER